MMRGFTICVLLVLVAIACLPERRQPLPELPGLAPFLQGDKDAVETAIREMSLEEKLGQLILVAREGQTESRLHQWVRDGRVGGVALSGFSLEHFLSLRDSLRGEAPRSLLYTTSGGALFNNQFTDAVPLPAMEALQALPSDSMKQQLRQVFLRQAASLGLNLAPAPYLNPVEQRHALPQSSLEENAHVIAWLNERHILSVVDGFAALPLLQPARDSLQDSIAAGYQYLIEAGVSGFWINPMVYDQPGPPPEAVGRFFRERLQFDGLLLAHLRADNQLDEVLASGVDLIVTHNDPGFVMDYLRAAYRGGELSQRDLHAKLRRILLAKQWVEKQAEEISPEAPLSAGPIRALPASMFISSGDTLSSLARPGQKLFEYFGDQRWLYWQRRFQEESIIVAANPDSLLPFRRQGGNAARLFHLGEGPFNAFDEAFGKYGAYESFQGSSWEAIGRRLQQVEGPAPVVLAIHNYGLDSLQAAAVLTLAKRAPLVLVNFRRIENLALLDSSLAVVHSFEAGESLQEAAAQLLWGGIPASGRLPFTVNRFFVKGQGMELPRLRLRYGLPQQADIAPERLVGIDAIVGTAIDEGAFPGCQVVVVKNGTVVYDKAFGYHTYGREQPVRREDLYDVASITKVAATTMVAMKLYEEDLISLNGKLRSQMSMPRNSLLRNLTVRKLMAHQSGLQPHMPVVPYLLYRDMENTDCRRYFCDHPSDTFAIQVAENFYFDKRYYNKIFKDVHRLRPRNRYRYSDVNFILLQKLMEEKTGLPLDSLAYNNFYSPMGLQRTGFRPLLHRDSSQVVPTQLDRRWRHQLIHGYVHDETAALLGGVAGNAGLFSNAEGLAVLFQMLLNGGAYGGERYFQPETVEYFTSARHGNHRGLGFDKPTKEKIKEGFFPEQISMEAFGHTGFTGGSAWADPEAGLAFIFLSNRIFPDANNRRIFQKRVRERIYQVIYDALDTYVPEMPEI